LVEAAAALRRKSRPCRRSGTPSWLCPDRRRSLRLQSRSDASQFASHSAQNDDKGYDGDDVRSSLFDARYLAGHPAPKANRKEPIACDFKAYKDRNRIERMFNRLKQFRRIATRYDKTALSFTGFLCLAGAKLWLPTLSTDPS
jgi:hypothetical protein